MENISWIRRFKLDTFFGKFTLVIIQIIVNLTYFYVIGFSTWLSNYIWIHLLVIILLSFIPIYIEMITNQKYQNVMKSTGMLFESNQILTKFKNLISKNNKSPLRKWIPLIFGLIFAIIFCANAFTYNFNYHQSNSEMISIDKDKKIFYIFYQILSIFYNTILIIIIFDVMIIIYIFFNSFKTIGSDNYPIIIKHRELKGGLYFQLGKFLTSLSLPIILSSFFLSIIGLLFNILNPKYSLAYFYMGSGIVVSIVFCFLLYRNTKQIHYTIVKAKNHFLDELLIEIGIRLSEKKRNYGDIENINNIYNDIKKIRTWPFDSKSIKSLLVSIISSIVPMILTLIGL